MEEPLQVERRGAAGVLTINRPEVMNALSSDVRRRLHRAIAELDADENVAALILTGAGDQAFTAGLDLKEAAGWEPGRQHPDEENPTLAIRACRKPVIAAVNGLCITGGMEIMLWCDIVLASTRARFADTHVRVGLMPGWGISQNLSRQVGIQRAKEISLTGSFYSAQEMYAFGAVNRVVDPDLLMPTAFELAEKIAANNLDAVMKYKAVIEDGFALTLAAGLELEHERAERHHMEMERGQLERGRQSATTLNRAERN